MKQDYKILWKTLAAAKKNTARHMAQYCILKAMLAKSATSIEDKIDIAKHLLRRAFKPITNVNKLANGRTPFDIISHGYNNPDHMKYSGTPGLFTLFIFDIQASEILNDEELVEFFAICKSINPKILQRNYSYFFTRQDIFPEYQLVQTSHAALELGAMLEPSQVKDLHFTVCGVENIESLEDVQRLLDSMHAKYVVFREPDIGNQKTSIAVFPIAEHKRGVLRNYNLLKLR